MRKGAITALVTVVVLGLGVTVVWANAQPAGTVYRTATVAIGSVSQTVSAVGSLEDLDTAHAAFATAGTIGTIAVAVGDRVTSGQVIGELDASPLTSAVKSAKTDLSNAKQTLADDIDAQTSAASETSATSSTATATPSSYTDGSTQRAPSQAAPPTSASPGTANGKSDSGDGAGAENQHAITTAQNAITACQQLVDYLIGQGVTAGTCAAAPGPATESSETRVPISQGCSVITAAGTGDTEADGTTSPPSAPSTVTVTEPPSTVTVTASPSTVTVTETPTSTSESDDTEGGEGLRGRADPALTNPPPTDGDQVTTTPEPPAVTSPGPTSTSHDANTATASAVTDCQSAIASAVDALNNLYSWELTLEKLLSANATAPTAGGASSAASGSRTQEGGGSPADGNTGADSATGQNETTVSHSGSGNTSSRSTNSFGSATSGGSLGDVGSQSEQPPTAADIAADQAQIDLMEANLAVARQNAKGATLLSPIDGTVAQIDMAVGDSVTAASTSKTITIVGQRQYQVTVSISLNQIDLIKTGQHVDIAVDGVDTPLTGAVTTIGILNDSATTTPSYPVVIRLDPTDQTLFDGAGASLTIDIGAVSDVLTVPTSAITTTGDRTTVTVWDGTSTRIVPVKTGLMGPELTQITSGLEAGQQVVLADVDQALPTSSSAIARGSSGGGNLLGGGGGGQFGRTGGFAGR